jgi:hypothetical protein
MIQDVTILVFTALASAILWWGSRFKLSEMTITDKTVGIGLPRLWCRAIG